MLNKYAITAILLLITGISFAQIKGTYIYSAGVDAGTRTLTFNGSGFTDRSTGHVSGKYGEGSFRMDNDHLYLNYFKLEDKDSSTYKINTGKELYGYTYIFVQAFDGKIPMNGVQVALRDGEFNIVFAADSMSEGKTSLRVDQSQKIQYFTVDFIGYNRVIIPFSKFLQKRSDVFVDLKPQRTMIEPPRKEIYSVVKSDRDNLILINSQGAEFLFTKSR
ncbi:hypothetical protein ACTJKC_11335 [Pedobacter sp. 22226]|uniref:hypothetical protein n=1 Tax=Pedobacter sp. 22226 TaxID=3453894 RepID=UPI003F8549A5